MTVLDSSAVVHYLLGSGRAAPVREMIDQSVLLAAPDVLTFEVVAVLRRHALERRLPDDRALES